MPFAASFAADLMESERCWGGVRLGLLGLFGALVVTYLCLISPDLWIVPPVTIMEIKAMLSMIALAPSL